MEFLVALWLPILLSAVAVFVASSVIHMATPMHKSDQSKLPDEERIGAALSKVPAGDYMFPRPSSMKECGSPEWIEKYKKGPVGFLTILPSGDPGMGKALLQWFLMSLAISFFVAYITWLGRAPGASVSSVFQMAGAAGVLGYGFGSTSNSIWRGIAWSTTVRFTVDGILYGLATGAAFAYLWPAAI
ncbi:MAG TPA: hypothetical protein PKA37_06115 [Planctomycetota bacterium]|jgi:hypothetical protein|nr:hypothetical protein [Planctomycetota bacterium]